MAKSRYWCFTINNPDPILDAPTRPSWSDATYIVWQQEQAGGPSHYQGYVEFGTRKQLTAMKKINPRAHWEVRKGTQGQAIDYCKKEDTRIAGPWEIGSPFESKQGQRSDLESVARAIVQGESVRSIAMESPHLYVQYGRGLHSLATISKQAYNHDDVRGEWYWGAPGTGKSRKAREDNPDAFIKAQNKWFDGYEGQKVIILDDLDTNVLGHYLKIWADRYACPGEIKGSTCNLVHEKIIITSNYSIDDLWPEDEQMRDAIKRRFKVTHFKKLAQAYDIQTMQWVDCPNIAELPTLGKRKRSEPLCPNGCEDDKCCICAQSGVL